MLVGRAALAMAISVVGGYATGVPMAAVAAGLTSLCTGFASQQGFYRTRLGTMIATTLSMTVCIAIGFFTVGSPVLSILALAVCGYVFGLVASLGPVASLVGVWATMSLVIFGHFPLSLTDMLVCVLASLGSGAVQMVLLMATSLFYQYPEERNALAALYRTLAQNALAGANEDQLLQQSEQLRKVRSILADPQPLGRDAVLTTFQTLLDEAERVRGTLANIGGSDAGSEADRRTAAAALDEIAESLERSRVPSNDDIRTRLDAEHSDQQVNALFGQLRAARRVLSAPLRGVSLRPSLQPFGEFPNVTEVLSLLRQNMGVETPFGRHALRFAVVLALSRSLEYALPFSRGYWITLTVAIVLRADYTTTFVRGIARIVGTLLGVVFATAVVVAFPHTPHAEIALTVLFAAVAFAFLQMNFVVFDVGVTGYIVFLLALTGQPEEAAILNRLLATIVGGVLAMISYTLWPTWESGATRLQIVMLIEKLSAYTQALFDGLAAPALRNHAKINAARNEMWRARAAAKESLERMLSEPKRTHEIPDEQALGVIAALLRIEFATLELWSIYNAPSTPALPEVLPFAWDVETAMTKIAQALNGNTEPPARENLRDAFEAMKSSLRDANTSAARVLLDAGDRLVDSTNTLWDVTRSASAALPH